MAGQVVLYFEDQADALRFALAAGSVMAGDGAKFTSNLVEETARVTRIRLDAVNAGNGKKPGRVMFELAGVPEGLAREAMLRAQHKLPIKTKFITRVGD